MKALRCFTVMSAFAGALFATGLCARIPVPASGQSGQNQDTAAQTKVLPNAQGTRPQNESRDTHTNWLGKDVAHIIADIECGDPTPGAATDECKEEHYRRFAYANEHFTFSVPGWMTDRGRVYIIWGKPDSVEAHTNGPVRDEHPGAYAGGVETFPFEVWHYNHLEGFHTDGFGKSSNNIELEFADVAGSNEYHLAADPEDIDALFGQSTSGSGRKIFEACQEWERDWKTKNLQGLRALYAHDADFLPAAGPGIKGRDAIGDYLKQITDSTIGGRMSMCRGTDARRNLAYATGGIQYVIRGSTAPVKGYYFTVFKQDSGSKWLIVYQALSEIPPQHAQSKRPDN
jgi:GWxTD domain-containing protein